MKRFSPREFVFLSSPLLLIALVGFLLSRRKPPSPNAGKLRLELHVEKPTVLEAFAGNNAAFSIQLKGPNTEWGAGKNPMRIASSAARLELHTGTETQISRSNAMSSQLWGDVWNGCVNSTRFRMNTRPIPAGTLYFAVDTQLSPASTLAATRSPHLSARWKVNREAIKPFPFDSMPRTPLVHLHSVKILKIGPGSVEGEAAFEMKGATMNETTPFDCIFNERQTGMGWGYLGNPYPAGKPRWRIYQWNARRPLGIGSQILSVTGRVSANARWPLAFQIQPFDCNKVRPGQKLKFKSWALKSPISN